jgi:hypothetical protein
MKRITIISMIMLLIALLMPMDAMAASTRGDVNGDNEVNIADVCALIDIVLGGDGNNAAADVNGDNAVNIADVTTLIDMILNGGVPSQNHEYVDLGLPSGTLWATCNVGATCPEEYGDYFAWGETVPKDVYSWSTYKWCNGTPMTLTKYCTSSSLGTVDDKTELEPEDDAATVNWGEPWCIPSREQQYELVNQCTWTWTTHNGVNGQLVTGPNGNTIFLPAAGLHRSDSISSVGLWGYYWSCEIFSGGDYHTYGLRLNEDGGHSGLNNIFQRSRGLPVRAVRKLQK